MTALGTIIRRSEAARSVPCLAAWVAIFLSGLFALFPTVSPVHAQTTDWRDSIGTFKVGYLLAGNRVEQRKKLEPFRRALEAATGLTVTLNPVRNLNDLVKMHAERRIQYAIHSASSYATAETFCKCLELLAAPSDAAGAVGAHAVVLVPASGAVNSLLDLKGKRLAVPAPPATLTRQVALSELAAAGFGEPGALGEIVDVPNPVEGWRKVLAGQAHAIVGWSSLQGDLSRGYSSGTMRHLIDVTGLANNTDLRIIWQSRLVPHGPHAVRSDVPTALKQLLKDFLIGLKAQRPKAYEAVSPELSGGFKHVEYNSYTSLLRLVRSDEP